MKMMKFGTSGLRGLVVDLEGRTAAVYAQAFARHLISSGAAKAGDMVVVGRDLRPSSLGIAATCIGALQREGFLPIDCGTVPTPALAHYGMSLGAACIMVTGSHLALDRNGIKFFRPDGEIDKADEIAISTFATALVGRQIDLAPGTASICKAQAEAQFLARNKIVLAPLSLAGLKIGVYQHSTVARDLLVSIFEHYGARVIALGRSEHFIPVDTEAISAETRARFRHWAKEHQLDALVSADGDGDRPLLGDEQGEPLPGDLLGLITARFLNADAVVTPVTSNSRIEATREFAVIRTKVGSPFVIAGMEMVLTAGYKRVVGFEANGGTLTASAFEGAGGLLAPLPTRDSFLPALAALYLRARRKQPLSVIKAGWRLTFAAAGRLENFPVEVSAALMTHLGASTHNLAAFLAPIGTIETTSDLDGLRVVLTDRRIVHIRPSGNAPEMRCYVEAGSEIDAMALLQEGLDLIQGWALTRGADEVLAVIAGRTRNADPEPEICP